MYFLAASQKLHASQQEILEVSYWQVLSRFEEIQHWNIEGDTVEGRMKFKNLVLRHFCNFWTIVIQSMKGILLVWFNWMPSQWYTWVSFWFYVVHGLVWFDIYVYTLWVVPSDIYCTGCLGPLQLVTGDLIICPLPSLQRLHCAPSIPPPIKSHRERF